MTDFLAITGRVQERAWCRAVGRPRSSAKDDSGTVRFNTIDRDRPAKAAGLEAARQLRKVGASNYFGDLVEAIEVFNRLVALVTPAHSTLTENADSLSVLAREFKSAREGLAEADLSSSRELKA